MTFVSFALELGRLMMPQLAVLIVLWVLCDFAVGKLNAPRPLCLRFCGYSYSLKR